MSSLLNPSQEISFRKRNYAFAAIICLFVFQFVLSILFFLISSRVLHIFLKDLLLIPFNWFIILLKVFCLIALILFVRKLKIAWSYLSVISLVQLLNSGILIWKFLNLKNLDNTARFYLLDNIVNFVLFIPILYLLFSKRILSTFKINSKQKLMTIISSIVILIIYWGALKCFNPFLFKRF